MQDYINQNSQAVTNMKIKGVNMKNVIESKFKVG